jgi:multiple sugar transport system substrate-binding protein
MKKTISAVLVLVMLLMVFSGCSGGKTQPSQSSAPQSSSSQSSSASSPAPAAAEPAKKIQLTFWHYFTATTYESASQFIKEYNALDTGKATIVEQYIPRNELLKRYTLGVVSNELPDLAMVDNPDSCSFAAMGMFVDITDKFNAWGDNKYQPGPLNSGKYKDKQFTLPMRSNCLALWTNDDMMKAAGVDKLPTTWDELDAVCQKLQKANPNVYPLAFSAVKSEEATFQFLPFLQSAGANINSVGSAEGIKAFSYITNLVKNKYVSAECINWTQNDVQKQFASGNAAMMVNGPWHIPNMKKDAPDLKYTVAYLPKDKEYASSMGGENIGITKACKDVDAAWDFVTWFLGTDNSIKFNVAAGTISPHSNATAEMQYPNNPVMKVFIEQLAYAVPRGPHPKWPELSAAIQDAIQQSITGAKTPEAAAKDAAAKITQINASIK